MTEAERIRTLSKGLRILGEEIVLIVKETGISNCDGSLTGPELSLLAVDVRDHIRTMHNELERLRIKCGETGHPADYHEVLTDEWVKQVLPATNTHGKGAKYIGRHGRINWQSGNAFVLWLNGELLDWQAMPRGEFRAIAAAIGVQLKTKSEP